MIFFLLYLIFVPKNSISEQIHRQELSYMHHKYNNAFFLFSYISTCYLE